MRALRTVTNGLKNIWKQYQKSIQLILYTKQPCYEQHTKHGKSYNMNLEA
jgi:hypothetical protein